MIEPLPKFSYDATVTDLQHKFKYEQIISTMAPLCRHLSVFPPLCRVMLAWRGQNWDKKVNFNYYPANWRHHCQKVSFVKFIMLGWDGKRFPLQSNSSSYTWEKLSSDLSPMKITGTSNYFSLGELARISKISREREELTIDISKNIKSAFLQVSILDMKACKQSHQTQLFDITWKDVESSQSLNTRTL